MTRRHAALLVALAAGAVLAHEGHKALPSRGAAVDLEQGTIVLSRESRDALDVQSADVAMGGLPQRIHAYAVVRPPWGRHTFASSRLPGRITRIMVQPGQQVHAGELLAEITSLDLEVLQQDVLTQRTELGVAREVLADLRKSEGVIPPQLIRDAEIRVRQAENGLLVNRLKWADLGLAENEFNSLLAGGPQQPLVLPVRALNDGTVVHVDLSIGRVIDPAEHLFEIVNLETVWVEIGILERDLPRVALGQPVELRFAAFPDEPMTATIEGIDASLTPDGLCTAWARLSNAGEPRLLPGMNAQASILLPPAPASRTIPADALIDDGVNPFVLIEEVSAEKQSEYRRKNVSVIRRSGSQVEIRGGDLLPGDRVAVRGAHELGAFFHPEVLKLSPEARDAIGLKLAAVEAAPVDAIAMLEGIVELQPNYQSEASAPLTGTLTALHVERGQEVQAGDVVAAVASLDFQNLQLEYLRERLTIELLVQQVAAQREAAEAIVRRRLLEAEASLAAARIRADNLAARLALVGLTPPQIEAIVRDKRIETAIPIRSPICGTVAALPRILGEHLIAQDAILQIQNLSQTQVRAIVPENLVARVRPGQPARVRLASDPDTVLEGRVVRSSRMLAEADQSLAVWIELPAGLAVRPGQLAMAAVVTEPGPSLPSVPRSAVVLDASQSFVFVELPDGKFDRVRVRPGRGDDQRVELLDGPPVGSRIAIRGAAALQTAFANIE